METHRSDTVLADDSISVAVAREMITVKTDTEATEHTIMRQRTPDRLLPAYGTLG